MARLHFMLLVVALVSLLAGAAGADDEPPFEAMRLYFAGVAELEEGKPARAVALFTKALALHPRYAHALFDRGRAHEAMLSTETALTDYTSTLALDARHLGALQRRAWIRMVAKNYEGATKDLARAVELAPKDATLHYRLGQVHTAQGMAKEAVRDFERVTTLDPKRADAWHMLGVLRASAGEIAPALEAYDEALKRKPGRADTHAAKGAAFAAEGLWMRAFASLVESHRLDPSAMHNVPDSALLRVIRAVVWMGARKYPKADLTLEIASLLDATAVRPRLLRWAIAVRLGGRASGEKTLEAWLDTREEEPDDPALDRIARYLAGRVKEDVLLKRAGVGDAAWYYVGLQHETRGETKAARECYEKCAQAKPPRCPEAHLAKQALKRL